jgi:hypothetical protein
MHKYKLQIYLQQYFQKVQSNRFIIKNTFFERIDFFIYGSYNENVSAYKHKERYITT